MHIALTILLGFAASGQLTNDFINLFTPLEYHYTGGSYNQHVFRYRLYIPNATKGRMPLIVWLHGFGQAGSDNRSQLKWLERVMLHRSGKEAQYPFFLLAVQCPLDNPTWTAPVGQGDDMVNVARAVLEETLHNFPIDRDRVYLAGICSGGSGCWSFAARYPEYFAAVAPMASPGGDNSQVEAIKNIPVWAFNSKYEALDGVRTTVAVLSAAGGNVHLAEIETAEHDCWTAAFGDYHLLDWLLSQRRGQRVSWAPGTVPLRLRFTDFVQSWQWWQALAQIALFIGASVLATWLLRSRRRASRRETTAQRGPRAMHHAEEAGGSDVARGATRRAPS